MIRVAAVLLVLAATGCATQPVLVRPEVHEVPVLRYADIPDALTAPLALPEYPAGPLTCRDLEAQIPALEAVIRRSNTDRANVARLSGALVDASVPATPDEEPHEHPEH